MNSVIDILILILGIIGIALYIHQGVYMVVSIFKKLPVYVAKKECRYAFLIAAKDEENVLPHLVRSLKAQKYPKELFEVFVVADNCQDNTAAYAREAGAVVYERFNTEQKGKGYALDYLFKQIDKDYGIDAFDGYLVFDADNLVDPDYIAEMNKLFSNGHRIITSYRAAKNFNSNWIAAGSGLWFLREARYINHGRMIFNTSCMVSGTGYLLHKDIVKKYDGWKFHLMTEDAEFSVVSVLEGEKIAYCETAVFYDEQPVRFIDSWNQRLRWTRGFYEVSLAYGGRILKRLFTKWEFACYDVLTIIAPGIIYITLGVLNVILILIQTQCNLDALWNMFVASGPIGIIGGYLLFWVQGFLVILSEWKKIYCSGPKKILYSLLFPIFMVTYAPMAIIALFVKVKWKRIDHSVAISNEEMLGAAGNEKK